MKYVIRVDLLEFFVELVVDCGKISIGLRKQAQESIHSLVVLHFHTPLSLSLARAPRGTWDLNL